MFPKLTAMQLSRLEAHGRRVSTQAGDVLVEPGQRHHDMVIVLAGSLEVGLPGGQAGTSSRIENYLGFPTGISGMALAGRALVQTQKFGANVNVACRATRLLCERRPYALELSDGRVVQTSTVIIATGAKYREPALANLPKFIGAGIYYAATHLEAKLCEGEEIVIVGSGNSAGQAAVCLAGGCRHVHILVRSEGLAESMSRYLIRRIEQNPRITLHTRTQITALDGNARLERLSWHNTASGQSEDRDIASVFMMTGAVPNTAWLDGCVAGWLRRARRQGFRAHRNRTARRRPHESRLAAAARALSSRNQPARRICGG